ncbi:DUF3019 domain-containing protein [Colwelliaceae bacterium 6441]
MKLRLNQLKTIVLLLAMLSNSHNAYAESVLSLSPQICVIEKKDERCQSDLKLHFKHSVKGDYCVVIQSYNIRRCYEQVTQFKLSLSLNNKQTVNVEVQEKQSKLVIAQDKMDVILYKIKKTRKRRNFGWNFL